MRIGIISDTHGFLDPRVFHHFAEVQYILHAGDVGDDIILDELEELAPVHAVSGNVDYMPSPRRPLRWSGEIGGLRISMTHGHMLDMRDYDTSAIELFKEDKPDLIIHGHTHVSKLVTVKDVKILNPGASCKPRFDHTAGIAIVNIPLNAPWFVEFIELTRR